MSPFAVAILAVAAVAVVAVGVACYIEHLRWRRRQRARRSTGATVRAAARDLADVLAERIAQADQIAATGAADLDAVDRHFATAAALLTPDAADIDAARLIAGAESYLRRAAGETDIPTIPGDPS